MSDVVGAGVGLPNEVSLIPETVDVEENLSLRFSAARAEVDLEGAFLVGGGTLGSATARGPVDFAITGSEHSVKHLITEKAQTVSIPLPSACYKRYVLPTGSDAVLVSDRIKLNGLCSRSAASINGTVCSTPAGKTQATLHQLLSSPEDGGQKTHMVPFVYPNWAQHTAVLAISDVAIVDEDGVEQDVAIYKDVEGDKVFALSQTLLKSIYDASWALRTEDGGLIMDECTNLTKSAMRISGGLDNSGYTLAAQIGNASSNHSPEHLESIMASCIGASCDFDDDIVTELLTTLQRPSWLATLQHANRLGTAMSTYAALTTPYRVDGAVSVLPTGVTMLEAESWDLDASRDFAADDCDGTGARIFAAIRNATSASRGSPGKYPHLDAIANSLGTHYVNGVSILGASAGHAAASEAQASDGGGATTALAGHACAIGIPAISFLAAHERGAASSMVQTRALQTTLDDGTVVSESVKERVPLVGAESQVDLAERMFKALYAPEIVKRMPKKEREFFKDWETLKNSKLAQAISGLQPQAYEGTTLVKSQMYVHEFQHRAARHESAVRDTAAVKAVSPSVLLDEKTLDAAGDGNSHSFYKKFAEFIVGFDSPIFKDESLREVAHATAQVVLSPPSDRDGGVLSAAGVTPQQLATGEFVVVPLWRVEKTQAKILDVSIGESVHNQLPRRAAHAMLTGQQSKRLDESLVAFDSLGDALEKAMPPKAEGEEAHDLSGYHTTRFMASFPSLIHNSKSIEASCASILELPGVCGEVAIVDADGLARKPDGTEAGALAMVTTHIPLSYFG